MMDISLTASQMVIFFIAIFYIVVLSVYSSKFHKQLNIISRGKKRFKLKRIDSKQMQAILSKHIKIIKRIKRRSYIIMGVILMLHLVLCLILQFNIIAPIILYLFFFLILLGMYWLKGSGVTSSLSNQLGTSDTHAC